MEKCFEFGLAEIYKSSSLTPKMWRLCTIYTIAIIKYYALYGFCCFQTILSSNTLIHKSRNYDLLVPWLGRGLLTNGGEGWHQKRKLLTPAFHFKILSTFKGPMEDCCNILIDQLNEVADGRTIDFYPYITLFALDVICGQNGKFINLLYIYSKIPYLEILQRLQWVSKFMHNKKRIPSS